MNRFAIPKALFISPKNPVLKIEIAIDCDGAECDASFHDEDGSLIDLPPHFHLVESESGAWTRKYAVGGPLPNLHFESSH